MAAGESISLDNLPRARSDIHLNVISMIKQGTTSSDGLTGTLADSVEKIVGPKPQKETLATDRSSMEKSTIHLHDFASISIKFVS